MKTGTKTILALIFVGLGLLFAIIGHYVKERAWLGVGLIAFIVGIRLIHLAKFSASEAENKR
jgi:cadmium resistance protein CadD (predicted permease)